MENSDLQPRSAKATDMIQVEPQVLRFQRPFNVARAQTVTVANRSPERIAFKVKTTAPKMYLVRPNCGVLGAGEHCVVSSTAAGRRKYLGERRLPLLIVLFWHACCAYTYRSCAAAAAGAGRSQGQRQVFTPDRSGAGQRYGREATGSGEPPPLLNCRCGLRSNTPSLTLAQSRLYPRAFCAAAQVCGRDFQCYRQGCPWQLQAERRLRRGGRSTCLHLASNAFTQRA